MTTPDPAEPNPQLPESYEPYSFANNNPHLYSDPTGLFTVVEISVSSNISNNLQRFQTVVVNNARQYAQREIKEWAVETFVNKLGKLLPTFGGVDLSAFIRQVGAGNAGKAFQSGVSSILAQVSPFPVWLEARVDHDGKALDSGLLDFDYNYHPKGKKREAFPDYLINEDPPASENAGRTLLVGDITLTANRLEKKYNPQTGYQKSQLLPTELWSHL